MPKATGLQFYRKRQSLDCLALERPQNLAAVYDIVKDSIQGIEMRLQMLITSFYGQGKTVENEVKRYLPSIESVIKPARYSSLVSRSQIEDISARHNDSTDKLRLDLQCFAVLQDCIVKTISTLRLGFADLINVVDKLLIYMRKYLLSFSSVEGDSYMETAINYEKQRRELEVAIRQSTKNITDMADNFDGEGLTIDMMDFEVKHIAERCDCLHASLLVAFPQACNDMRRACKGLSAWLEADEYYTTYLQYDIDNLEKKRETQAKKSRDLQLKTCNVEYRLKSVKKDYDEYNEELSRLEQKEQALVNDESLLQVAHHDVNFDLEIKEYRMAEMRRHVHKNTSREFHESYERLQREINVLKEKKPTIDRKLEDIRKKTSWIRDKRERGREKLDQLEKLKSELKLCKKAARRAEVELQRLDGCLVRLKDIHRMKSCPEVLKKIFHNLPFTPRPSHSRKKTDILEKALRLIANHIDGDWMKLYRELPFYPPRGDVTINVDIDDIASTYMRHTVEEQARQCLARWRRMHTRATLDDIRTALTAINRKDLVDRLEERLPPSRRCQTEPKQFRTVHFPKLMV